MLGLDTKQMLDEKCAKQSEIDDRYCSRSELLRMLIRRYKPMPWSRNGDG